MTKPVTENARIAELVSAEKMLWSGVRRAHVMQQVRKLMREKGLRNIDLAERLGIAVPSVSRMLRGRQNIEIDTLYRLADALEVPLQITFGGDDE
jgi:transcriptional regulator with XRE-family HTH domain